jgi:hypothetical protein
MRTQNFQPIQESLKKEIAEKYLSEDSEFFKQVVNDYKIKHGDIDPLLAIELTEKVFALSDTIAKFILKNKQGF